MNLRDRDNLRAKDKRPVPKVSFVRRLDCTFLFSPSSSFTSLEGGGNSKSSSLSSKGAVKCSFFSGGPNFALLSVTPYLCFILLDAHDDWIFASKEAGFSLKSLPRRKNRHKIFSSFIALMRQKLNVCACSAPPTIMLKTKVRILSPAKNGRVCGA